MSNNSHYTTMTLRKFDIKTNLKRRDTIGFCLTMLAMLIKGIMNLVDFGYPWYDILKVTSYLAVFVSYTIIIFILLSKSDKYKDKTLSLIVILFNSVFFSL